MRKWDLLKQATHCACRRSDCSSH